MKELKHKYIANIDIKSIKDSDTLKHIVYSATCSKIQVDLEKLKTSPKAFTAVLAANIDNLIKTGLLSKMYNDNIRNSEADNIVNSGIIKFTKNIKAKSKHTNYKHGKKIPEIIYSCIPFMTDNTKSIVLSEIIEKRNNFYPYSRKLLITVAVKLANSDKELLEILSAFYKVMDGKDFYKIAEKITDGPNNSHVQKILEKTNKFNVCNYTKSEIESNDKKRIELLKHIIRTPSSAKNLNFTVTFTAKDFKKVAPMMRFKFLQWCFKYKFGWYLTCYYAFPTTYKERVSKAEKNTGLDKIIINMNEKELYEILFSVGLKKNNEVIKFVNNYKCYKKINNGNPLTRNEVKPKTIMELHGIIR